MEQTKPISFSIHARLQMALRGAEEVEVVAALREGRREQGQRGKFQSRRTFHFDKESPVNGQHYKYKAVEAVFADESDKVVVVTVKVYYFNREPVNENPI